MKTFRLIAAAIFAASFAWCAASGWRAAEHQPSAHGTDAEPAAGSDSNSRIGRNVDNFVLPDHQGRTRSLDEIAGEQLAVIAFLGVDCPLAQVYGRRLADLSAEFGPRGVAFMAVNSNAQDSAEELAEFARRLRLPFPVLKDAGHRVADALLAVRTPEVFVLDRGRAVRYWGRIDDQFAIGVQRQRPRRRDLALALEELLAGKSVSVPLTESAGCHIGRAPTSVSAVSSLSGPITYIDHVAPILRRRCTTCHRPGEATPFSLTSYQEIVPWARMMREVIGEGRMPPWFADPAHGQFENDARLTAVEKRQLLRWIDDGCPWGEGEFKDDIVHKSAVASGWRIPPPDKVIYMSDEPFTVPADGQVDYQYYLIDPGFSEDKFITAVQVRPGAPDVVHHALVTIVRPGDESMGFGTAGVLMNYAPGMQPTQLPPGMAIHVPAGGKFLFQMHYTPRGVRQEDRTRMGLVFADPADVKHRVTGGVAANVNIEIPPGAARHGETAERVFDQDVLLLSLSPHLHLRGRSFRFEAVYPNGASETLLYVPRYDYNWQLRYILAEPKHLPRGTRLRCTAHYDNSANNPANPDPTQTVHWGDQTWEEMLIGFFSVVKL